ncbi:MAG TPA: hypothetical protein VH144_02550 [Candidatus Saccharimonadales bacterium]|jgi:hypothetical protein|nr:hypothetical protein [Candidatus Saccharimonadales bacterium]
MKKVMNFLQKRAGYIAVAIASLGVGCLLTVTVAMAAIPDANGVIHGCRSNLTAGLRVIDSASQNCNGAETSLNWDQNGVKGYAHILYNAGTNTYSLDSTHSRNISNFHNGTDGGAAHFACFSLGTTPQSISFASDNGTTALTSIKDANGWTGSNECDALGYGGNVLADPNDDLSSFFVTLF